MGQARRLSRIAADNRKAGKSATTCRVAKSPADQVSSLLDFLGNSPLGT
jgi:hypothetical protein